MSARLPQYPNYKNSGVEWLGDIPEHWETKRIRYAAPISNERCYEPVTDLPYIALEHIQQGTGRLVSDLPTGTTESTTSRFRAGDVLFGKLRPYLAKVLQPEFDGICSTELLVLRSKDQVEPKLLAYQLLSQGFIAWIDSLTYGTKMPRANPSQIANTDVAVPQPAEQRAIAAFLDRETAKIDALVAKKERLIELLQEKRTALITQDVTKGLDPDVPMKDSGVEWLGAIPAHWEVKRLRHVGEAIIGLTFSPSDVVGPDQGTLVLRASNVREGRVVLDDNVYVDADIPDRLFTRAGDILICSRSGSRALIGKNAVIDSEAVGYSFGAFMTVLRTPYHEFLSCVLNSMLFEHQSGSFLTSTINQLTIGNLKSFRVPMPPVDEAKLIADFVNRSVADIDSLVEKIRLAVHRLKELRTALISAAVTGKIDVRGEAA